MDGPRSRESPKEVHGAVVLEARSAETHSGGRLLVRDRLIGALTEARKPLALLSAPPGFGKTTLLQQWRAFDERPFAWVSVEAADNDPILFWTRIVEALRAVEPSFGSAAQIALHARHTDVVETVVPLLAHDLGSLGREVVLTLDDYHRIENPICHESLEFLLSWLPSCVTLTLSTRADPPISVGTLRGRGDLLELRAVDLCFTEQEEAEFLNERIGLGLEPESLSRLHERTEGWPAGVHLASLSLEEADDRAEFVARFGGSNRHVVDYLTEVTLSSLRPRWRAFLLETAVLDTFCAPLADALSGGDDSADLLEELEHANLFLVALDDRREWYRYHQLFGELLRAHLKREFPARIPTLHLRAFEWYREEGFTEEAVRHAVGCGALEAAGELVSERWAPCLDSREGRTTLGWLALLPVEAVAGDARLLLAKAWACSMTNQRADALHALQGARGIGLDGALPDGSSLEAIAAVVDACFPRGDVRATLAAAERGRELENHLSPPWQPLVSLSLGWAQYLVGDWDEARASLEQAVTAVAEMEQWPHVSIGNAILTNVALAMGETELAELRARDALIALESLDVIDPLASGMADLALGAVLGRSNVREAERTLQRAVVRLRAHGEPLLVAEALLVLAPARRDVRGMEAGRDCIAEARELLAGCADPGILAGSLEQVARSLTPAYRRVEGDSDLTEREREVLRYLAEGLPKRDIGSILFLSYNTVHSHTKSIYQKLRVSSRQAAVEKARELGAL